MADMVQSFSIPILERLEDPDGWHTRDDSGTRYFCARVHFHVYRVRDDASPVYYGEHFDVINTTKGAASSAKYSTKYRLSVADAQKSVASSLLETSRTQTSTDEIATELAASASLGLTKLLLNVSASGKLTQKDTDAIQDSLKTQYNASLENSTTIIREVETVFEQTISQADGGRELLILPQFRRRKYDVHLTFLDYLFVDYTRELLQLRKRRKKTPPHIDKRGPRNLLKLSIPLKSIVVWEPYQSVAAKPREEITHTVDDPTQIVVEAPIMSPTPYAQPPGKPSLYHLSNAAFPLKWVKRKGPWTEDDLKEAEFEEARDSAWWFEYGPGRRSRAA